MRVRRVILSAGVCCLALMTGGCATGAGQSALDPAGPQASDVARLFRLFLWVSIIVQVGVTLALVPGFLRRTKSDQPPPLVPVDHRRDWHATMFIGVLTLLTTAILGVLLVGDFLVGRAAHAAYAEPDPVKIRVLARQWWWEVTYPDDAEPSKQVTTANELHIPTGRTVEVRLESNDVIHSFWIPNLHGKKDMIPGHPTTIRFRADRPGTYYGQCAEFCGEQHAKMRFVVVVEPPEYFDAWKAAINAPAREPSTDSQRKGQNVFLTSSCVMCHQIDGTPARSRVGPVLTHLASRPTIAAGSLPNNRGNLAGWVLDPHAVKPGTRMPQNALKPDELHALLDYLESLK